LIRLCEFGCLVEQNYNCTCDWSEWTAWGTCSNFCSGTKNRYKEKFCEKLTYKEEIKCEDSCIKKCLDLKTNKSFDFGEITYEDECLIK
jgi:hypothetical protein